MQLPHLRRLVLTACAVMLTLFGTARAGTWSFAPWTGDSDTGIVYGSTTVAYHFGGTDTAAISGFPVGGSFAGLSSTLLDVNVGSTFQGASNDLTALGGSGSAILAGSFAYNGQGNPVTVSAKGLAVGQTYAISFFGVGFDTPGTTRKVLFTSGSDSREVDQDVYGLGKGIRVTYSFTATATTQSLTLTNVTGDWGLNAVAVRTAAVPAITAPTSGSISSKAAELGGNVTSDGGAPISERGVVYALTSANASPAIGGTGVTKVTAGGTTGIFTVTMKGLTASSNYTFKAYATNAAGTTYTSGASFTTTAADNFVFNSGTDVPVATPSFTASGTATPSLGYAPVTGTTLMMVKNTGLGFINGAFSNLAQGQAVALTYGGVTYNFVANYYGGSGNDLVLQWANVRPMAWGYNYSGLLGNGGGTNSSVPTAVVNSGVLAGKTVIASSAGGTHTLTLCSDGTLAASGYNGNGQLGNNTTNNSIVPVAVDQTGVLAGKTVIAVAAGANHSVVVCSDGTVAAWGRNSYGQLGNSSTTDSSVPVAVVQGGVLAGKKVIAVAAGDSHSLVLCSDGTLAAWGSNGFGSGTLGNGSTTDSSVPVAVVQSGLLADKTVIAVAAGSYHCLALCSDGTLATWGDNGVGQLGNGRTSASSVPIAVQSGVLVGKPVIAVAAGHVYSLALCSDGTLAAWGNGTSLVPVAVVQSGVLAGKTVIAVAAGQSHSLALCADGTLTAWGSNSYGQLGNNSTTDSNEPVAVSTTPLAVGERFITTASGPAAYHSLALVAARPLLPPTVKSGVISSATATGATLGGTVNANGLSTTVTFQYGTTTSYGQTATAAQSPVSGTSDTVVSAAISGLTTGTTYHFRVTATNSVGTTQSSDSTFTVLSSGLSATYTAAGNVPVTAANPTLIGGAATLTLGYAPVTGTNLTVVNNTGLDFISGAFSNLAQGQAVALSYGGVTYNFVANYYGGSGNDLVLQWASVRPLAWGDNSFGMLGNNSTTQSNVPTAVRNTGVLAGKTVVAFASGSTHSLALCSDGTLAAWGYNGYGQLGNNSTTDSHVPVAVDTSGALSGKKVVSVSAGLFHNVALCSDGTVVTWGDNAYGQLGNNSTARSPVPVAVMQNGALSAKRVTAVSAGQSHSVALCSDGTVAAWGYNLSGQLGNNSTTDSWVPVTVVQNGVLSGKAVAAIAAGASHNLALCTDGTLVAWGINGNGSLGTNSTNDSSVPVAVDTSGVLSGKTVTAVAAGSFHSLALCSDGTVATWGYNTQGQLGNNDTSQTKVPVAVDTSGVLAGKTVVALAGAYYHSVAVCSDGTAAAWGDNSYGELGNNSTSRSLVPVAVTTSTLDNGERFCGVGGGINAYHTLALVAVPPPLPPTAATGLASSISTNGTTLGGTVNANGSATIVTFEYGLTTSYGQTATAAESPLSGTSDTSVSAAISGLTAGTTYHFRVTATNSIGTTNGSDGTFTTPIANVSAAYTSAGDVPVTAANPTLSGGTATLTLGYAPVAGTNLTVVKNTGLGFISGTFSNLAQGQVVPLTYGGVTYNFVANYYGGSGNDLVLQWANVRPLAWGNNGNGQLGNNSTTQSNVPTAVLNSGVLSGKTVVALAVGAYHSLALCTDGTLAAWGFNPYGQLGNDSTTDSAVPVAVNVASGTSALFGKTVVAVAAGYGHSVALCNDGTVAAWGNNGYGQLGNNSTTTNLVPVAVNVASGTSALFGKTVVSVAAGQYHSVALCSDGTVAAWGNNGLGQLGNNSYTDSPVPVAVNVASGTSALSGKPVVSLVAGADHSLALCGDGTVAAWGWNVSGQLGNNSQTDSPVPVAVNLVSGTSALSGKTVVSVAGGVYHSLALCSDGTVAAWGANYNGHLGNNSTTDSPVPVAVNVVSGTSALYGKTVVSLVAGADHSLALCGDGTVAAWGYNGNGQLGNNSQTDSPVPVPVNTSALASGERFSLVGSGQGGYHALAIVASLPPPEIAVEQPVGTGLTDGSSTIAFGVMAAGSSTTAKTFTIKNLGVSDLTGIVITTDGANAGDYIVSTTGMTTTVAANDSTTFTVTFTPAAASVSGTRTAALHIASNDPNQNPFDIALSGTGLSQTYDTDADGLNDAAEFKLTSLGFDWQTAQPALVATLTTNANTANLFTPTQVAASRQSGRDDVTGSPNTYSLYTQSQFQALSVGVPLLQMNGTTGQFKLTIGVQKSTDLMHFDAFPLTAPQTTVNAQGQLEFQFTVPDGAAFFRLQSQ